MRHERKTSHRMTSLPFVSIIIPTRNRVARLEATIHAVRQQDYPRELFEIVVVDDGSSDGTSHTVVGMSDKEGLSRVRYLLSEGHGANAARNTGIKMAGGELACLIDDDVLPPMHWLRTLVAAIIHHQVDIAWGPVLLPPDLKIPGRHRSEVVSYLSESTTPQIPLLCNFLARRSIFKRGQFDPRWSAPVEEAEWLVRTNPSRAFAEDAWLWHSKSQEDCRFLNLLRIAWRRGAESGRFERSQRSSGFRPLGHALVGASRSVGHAVMRGCLGGLLVAAGRAGFAIGYAVASLSRRENS